MKKILTLILTLTMIFTFTACGGGEEHTYVVPPKACNSLFGSSPENVVIRQGESPWIGDNYVSMEEDKEGNLVIVLNDKHVEHWRQEILEKFERAQSGSKKAGDEYGHELSDDYKKFTYYTDRKSSSGTVIKIGMLFPYCGIMQMLDGVDLNEWYVDIEVIDVDTGITVKEGRLPRDKKFGVLEEDWEKAVGKAE